MENEQSASVSTSSYLSEVRANPDLLERVVINPLGDALKFTPTTDEITIKAEPHACETRFSVTDTGPGIVREYQGKFSTNPAKL